MIDPLFNQLLTMKRREMKPFQRKASYKQKLPVWLFPFQYERDYARQISQALTPVSEEILRIFTPELLQTWVKEVKGDSHEDGFAADLVVALNQVRDIVNSLFITNPEPIRGFVSTIGFDTAGFNQKQWSKIINKVVGINYIKTESWETETINLWSDENFNLIKGLADDVIKKINLQISNGTLFGKTAKEMEAEIRETLGSHIGNYKNPGYRARLIARDQVGKLNGVFTQRRQTDVGINVYEWSTSGDERVRDTHREMDGKLCRWDDSSVMSSDGGKTWVSRPVAMQGAIPGSQINCLPAGTAVRFNSDIIACYRRRIFDKLTVLITEDGTEFSCTGNHPVLTRRGWVPADTVQLNEDVFKVGKKHFSFSKIKPDNSIPTVEELFSFFACIDGIVLNTINGDSTQFHGDGVPEEKVEIIFCKSGLLNKRNFLLFQKFRKFMLTKAFIKFSTSFKPSFSTFIFSSLRFLFSAYCNMGFFSKGLFLFFRKIAHTNVISFRAGSYGNSRLFQTGSNPGTSDSIFFGTGENAHTADVISDKSFNIESAFIPRRVIFKGHKQYSGYVYNFETLTGWYTGNGLSIKNCRCSSLPYMNDIYGDIDAKLTK